MTLLQIRNIIDYLLTLQGQNIKLTKERFTDILTLANLEYFEEQVRQKNWDNLRPFTKTRGDQLSQPVTVTNGIMTYPQDFYQPVSASVKIPYGSVYKSRDLEKVDNEVFDSRVSNPVTSGRTRYPFICYKDGYARVHPESFKKVYLTYLALPTAPVYAQKVSGGVNVYDSANSVELQWSNDCQMDVMRKAMQHLGIKIGRSDVYQAMESQAVKEKQITV